METSQMRNAESGLRNQGFRLQSVFLFAGSLKRSFYNQAADVITARCQCEATQSTSSFARSEFRIPHRDHSPLIGAMGKEPSTVSISHLSARDESVRLTFASSEWPSKSTKKMYSLFCVRAGKDSIQVRLILFCLNRLSASTREPGWWLT